MTKEDLKEKIDKVIEDFTKEQEENFKKELEKKPDFVLDNKKIILSSDIFCKMVNVIAYAENNDLIDPLLNDIVEDVKKNKTNLSEKSKKKVNSIPKQEKYEFHPHTRRLFPTLFDDFM